MTGAILEVVGFLQLKNKILFYQLTKIKNKPSHDEFLKKEPAWLRNICGVGSGRGARHHAPFPFQNNLLPIQE